MEAYLDAEKQSELWIRGKTTNPIEVIFRHKNITSDKDLIPTLMEKQEEALARFDLVVLERKSHAMEACFSRWKELIEELKKKGPHYPFLLNRAPFKASMCKETIRKLKLDWIGHKLASPLLLTLNPKEDVDEEKEMRNWEHIEKAIGYVNKGDPMRIVAFNARAKLTKHH